MEETHRTVYAGRDQSFSALPNLHCVPKLGSSLNLVPLGFFGGSISQT